MKQVCVVGLGYVGLPLFRRAVNVGYSVVGVDKDIEVLTRLRRDELFLKALSSSCAIVNGSDVILVCVPTPIKADKTPNLTCINEALNDVGKNLQKGQLVSIESTVYPGYCEEIGREILETTSGLRAGDDFYLVHCPERISPGDGNWSVANIPRVIGGINVISLDKGAQFYQTITEGRIHSVKNMAEAEAAKMVENAFRDINIAFVNELARSFDGTNVDIKNVIDASATKPFGYMPFYPGLGVGGHCIPVDPEYLISAAKNRGFEHEIMKLARRVNDGMVGHVADKLKVLITTNGILKPRIAILGLAYKPNIADTRESQALRLRDLLISRGYDVMTYDPYVSPSNKTIESSLKRVNIVILATAHHSFSNLVEQINDHSNIKIVLDTTNSLDGSDLNKARYSGIGRSL